MSSIFAAGNVEIPAYLVLLEKGYQVSCEKDSYTVSKDNLVFGAEGLVEVLGVVSVYENRGVDWKANDQEIDTFLQKYHPTS